MKVRMAAQVVAIGTLWLSAQIPIQDGERILFVGNSYTGFEGGLHNHVKTICSMGSPSLNITADISWAGGTELLELYDVTDAVSKIRTGNYDIVVLQADNDPFIDTARFFQAVRKFDVEIKAAGAQTVLFMPWTYPTQELGSYSYCLNNHNAIAAEVGAYIVPVGTVWWGMRKRPPLGLEEFACWVDGGNDCHQDDTGQTLNTYIFYAALTGRSPMGINFGYGSLDGSSALADTLKMRAWSTVSHFAQPGLTAVRGWAAPSRGAPLRVLIGHGNAPAAVRVRLNGARIDMSPLTPRTGGLSVTAPGGGSTRGECVLDVAGVNAVW
jgi:hypothetical protein